MPTTSAASKHNDAHREGSLLLCISLFWAYPRCYLDVKDSYEWPSQCAQVKLE